jgi:beta-1,4-mannosyl-glycoprotein beta-1,4-N-acetylglucosaminyltransferase
MEAHQRNAMLRALTDAAPDDIVIISDVDEVPRCGALTSFAGSPAALELDYFYYRLNCRNLTQKWVAPVLLRRGDLKNPQELRLAASRYWKSNIPVLRDAGWHFSCIDDAAGLRLKLQSFSHAECNTPELTEINAIQDKIRYGLDLVNRRKFYWCCVPLDNSFPRYLLEHQDEFSHILFNFVEFHRERQDLIYSLQDDLKKAHQTISQLRNQALQTTQQVQAVLHSKSWKMTEPLRSVAHKIRRLYSGRERES